MPKNRSIFLFAFANDDKNYLAQLKEEERLLRQSLAGVHDQEIIEYLSLSHTDFEDIYDSFYRSRERLAIFHYGGHSDSVGLQLEDRVGDAENLAVLFGKEKGLKLVFLNGCSTRGQVEVLWQAGVPAVIATSADIGDTNARDLARHFYKAIASGHTIKDAFEIAASTIREMCFSPSIYRSIGNGKGNETNDQIPWGLYAQDESVLDWSIHSIETSNQVEALEKLRQASLNRYSEFTGERGRFRHLKIDEAILAGIPGIKRGRSQFIDHGIRLHEKHLSLEQSLPLLWRESCPHAMIIGAGGMGKTVSLLRLWEKWSNSKGPGSPVPIFIQLNEFNNRPESGFIRSYIQEHFADVELHELFKKANKDVEGQRRPHLVLLLDGLNEVTASSNELLLEINQLKAQEDYPGVQLVISSRVDIRDSYQWQAFHSLNLQPLSNKQITDYLRKDLPTDSRLLELLGNPMMLSLYAAQSDLPEHYLEKGLLKEKISSTGELLYNVESVQRIKIEELYVTKQGKVLHRRFILEHLLPYIGWQMQQAGIFSVGEGELDNRPGLLSLLAEAGQDLIDNDFFRTFKNFRKMDRSDFLGKEGWELVEQVIDQVCCTELGMLVNENEEYRFLHQNLRDYFAARHVQNQMQLALKNKILPDVLRLAPLGLYVRQLLGELEEEHTNRVDWNPNMKKWQWSNGAFHLNNHLTGLLELCRGVVYGEDYKDYTLWNILTIWTEQRGELSGAQLQRLDLRGFYLNGYRTARAGLRMCLSDGNINTKDLFPQGHSGWIKSIAYSPDGSRVVSCSTDDTIKVWDAKTGECLFTLHGHSDWVMKASFCPDGARIISASYDKMVKVWDAKTGACISTLTGHWAGVNSVTFSPTDRNIVSGSVDGKAKVWDANTGKCILTLEGHSTGVNSVAYSPNGTSILSGSDDQTAKIWDAKTGKCISNLKGHQAGVMSVAYSPNGVRIVTGSYDHKIKVWDTNTGRCIKTLEGHWAGVMSVAYSPDGSCIVSGSNDATIRIWDARTGRCIKTLEGHWAGVWSTSYSPDGLNIVSGSDDHMAKVWDVKTGKCVLTLKGHSAVVNSTSYSPDGTQIVNGSSDHRLKLMDAKTGKCLLVLEGHVAVVNSTSYSPDGMRIVSGSKDHTAKVWDANTGKCILTLKGHSAAVNNTSYSPSGLRIVSGSEDHMAKVWDANTGKCILTLRGHSAAVNNTSYSPSGLRIVSSSDDNTAKVWDANTGKCILTLRGHSAAVNTISYSTDGLRLISNSDDYTIRVWDANTGKQILKWRNPSPIAVSTACSPDGAHIASSSDDYTIRVFKANTGKHTLTLKGHLDWVTNIAYCPDGTRIVSGSSDKTTKVWDAQTGKCILTLPNIPGLFIQGCDFRGLHRKSGLPEEEVILLRQYGGIFNDKDAEEWERLMEKHFGIRGASYL